LQRIVMADGKLGGAGAGRWRLGLGLELLIGLLGSWKFFERRSPTTMEGCKATFNNPQLPVVRCCIARERKKGSFQRGIE
jgi:hypothetical protein